MEALRALRFDGSGIGVLLIDNLKNHRRIWEKPPLIPLHHPTQFVSFASAKHFFCSIIAFSPHLLPLSYMYAHFLWL
jgi:hypothetical protein